MDYIKLQSIPSEATFFRVTKYNQCRSYRSFNSNNCGLNWDRLQQIIMHYIIALKNNSLSQSNFNEQTNIILQF